MTKYRTLWVLSFAVVLFVSACTGSTERSIPETTAGDTPTSVPVVGVAGSLEGAVFSPGDVVNLDFERACQPDETPSVSLSRQFPVEQRVQAGELGNVWYGVNVSFNVDAVVEGVALSLPLTMPAGDYRLKANCRKDDYGFGALEDVNVVVVDEPYDRVVGVATLEPTGDRTVRFVGELVPQDSGSMFYGATLISSAYPGVGFRYTVMAGIDLPQVGDVNIVVPDVLPAGEYNLTYGLLPDSTMTLK